MHQYLALMKDILDNGQAVDDRTGTGTRSVFGRQMRFDLSNDQLPLVTTKKVFTRGIIEELLWFLRGSTNNEELVAENVHIWDGWAVKEDVMMVVPLSPFERATLLAEKLQKPVAEAIEMLQEADRNYVAAEGEQAHAMSGGFKLLDSNEIPTTREVITVRKGELGPIYGKQWRAWQGADGRVIDQIAEVIENLKTRPFSRRHVVTAWNPTDLPDESVAPDINAMQGRQSLASCHCLFQFYVKKMTLDERIVSWRHRDPSAPDGIALAKMSEEQILAFLGHANIPDKKLSCQLYQRSCDFFLGVPFNIASYAILTAMVAQVCNMERGEFVWTGGDVHLYSNTLDQAREQLTREPYPLPKLRLNPDVLSINDFQINDFVIEEYVSHPAIKAAVSV